jgi:6-phosphogluconolactonase
MQLSIVEDAQSAAELAARHLVRACTEAIKNHGRAVIAVSGGETPWAALREFAKAPLPWSRVFVSQVDERCVPRADAQRNLTRLEQELVSDGPLPSANLLAMPVDAPDLETATSAYALDLARRAEGTLDLVQLGLGSDGHTASLVPGDPVLEVDDRDVALAGPYQGTRRMTLTFRALSAAQERLWLVTGEAKAAALEDLLSGRGNAPAVRVARERSLIVADKAAARLVDKADRG